MCGLIHSSSPNCRSWRPKHHDDDTGSPFCRQEAGVNGRCCWRTDHFSSTGWQQLIGRDQTELVCPTSVDTSATAEFALQSMLVRCSHQPFQVDRHRCHQELDAESMEPSISALVQQVRALRISDDTLDDDLPCPKELPVSPISCRYICIRRILTPEEAHDSSMNRWGAALLQGARVTQLLRPVELLAIEVTGLPVYPVPGWPLHLHPVFNHLEIRVSPHLLELSWIGGAMRV